MKTLKMITLLFLFLGIFTNCSTNKDLRKAQKEEEQTEKSLEKQAKKLANNFKSEGYQISDLMDMENAIYKYLKIKAAPGSISEETSVIAPTDNIGKTKCLVNIKGRIAKTVCDSIRYRVDEATGGDEASGEYVDKFFSASEHLGILTLGSPDVSFTLYKKVKKNSMEYRMFAVYSNASVNSVVTNGVKFGNQIKQYIDNGLNK
jgi:hypothetical protein